MTIEEYFNSCPNLISFKKASNYKIIETAVKPTWKIPKADGIKANLGNKKDGLQEVFFYSENRSFDDLYSWFISSVMKPNVENEQKERLLKEKVEELKNIFQSSSLDDLKNLSFDTRLELDINNPEEVEEETLEENGTTD